MANDYQQDNSLKLLAKEITAAIEKNSDGSIQKDQVEELMALEESFRKSINHFAQSRDVYRQFIILIAAKNKNILSARPYFREKSKTFSSEITPAIKNSDIKKLQTFHINYNLIKFIKDRWKGPFPKRASKIYDKLIEARRKLIENNMPLVINRAKLFYRKVPKNHLSLTDMIGIAAMGLVSGVDKWVGEYTRVFNGVCIGRMVGNMIDSYSETTLHFYPSDRSILYRANSLKFRHGIDDIDHLVEAINRSYEEDAKNGMKVPKNKIAAEELGDLMSAASPVPTYTGTTFSSETGGIDGSPTDMLNSYVDRSVDSCEDSYIKEDLLYKTIEAARGLTILEQKVLRLKGVKL